MLLPDRVVNASTPIRTGPTLTLSASPTPQAFVATDGKAYGMAIADPLTLSGLVSTGAVSVGGAANTTQLTVKAHAAQSPANALMKFVDSAGTELARITADSGLNLFFGKGSGAPVTSGIYNTAFGYQSLPSLTSGSSNSAFGLNALIANTEGNSNTAFGQSALASVTTASNSTAVGYGALTQSTTSSQTAVGSVSLFNNTTGQHNAALGYASLFSNVSGSYNVAVGMFAGYLGTNHTGNVLAGYQAGFTGAGSYNVAVGYGALYLAAGTSSNVALGTNALHENVAGNQSIAIGHDAGFSSLGSGNVFIGTSSGYYETGSNKLYIANSATTTPLIYGDFASQSLRFNATVLATGNNIGVGAADGYLRMFLDPASGNAGIGSNLFYNGSNWVYANVSGYGGLGTAIRIRPGEGVQFYKASNGANPATTTEFASWNESGDYFRQGVKITGARATGWTAPTGTATRATFDPATVTLPQLAERVKALVDDLTAHGLIGA